MNWREGKGKGDRGEREGCGGPRGKEERGGGGLRGKRKGNLDSGHVAHCSMFSGEEEEREKERSM